MYVDGLAAISHLSKSFEIGCYMFAEVLYVQFGEGKEPPSSLESDT
jgi:hypothetical protein